MSALRQVLFAVALLAAGATVSTAGDLAVVGTGDGLEVLRAVGAAYTADHPDTSVLAPPSVHSSSGIAAVRSGTAVLGRIDKWGQISRPTRVPKAGAARRQLSLL